MEQLDLLTAIAEASDAATAEEAEKQREPQRTQIAALPGETFEDIFTAGGHGA